MANTVRILITAKDEVSGPIDKIRDKASALSKTDIGKGMAMGAGIAAFGMVKNAAMGALDAVVDFGAGSIKAASNLRESMALSEQVFEGQSAAMEDWAGEAVTSFGASKREALNYAATFGTAFKNVGMALDDVAERSRTMAELAGDLGSAFNTSSEEAAIALRSGLLGESEPMRKFGVFMDEAKTKAKALEMGMKPLNGAFSDGQKVAARYALIMEQTADSQGMFGRDTGSLADAQKSLGAELENLSADLGALIVGPLKDLVTWAREDGIPALKATADAIIFLKDAATGEWIPKNEIQQSIDLLAEQNRQFAAGLTVADKGPVKYRLLGTAAKAAIAPIKAVGEATKVVWDDTNKYTEDMSTSWKDYTDDLLGRVTGHFDKAMDIMEARAALHSAKGVIEHTQARLRLLELGALGEKEATQLGKDLEKLSKTTSGAVKAQIDAALEDFKRLRNAAKTPISIKVNYIGSGKAHNLLDLLGNADGGPIPPYGLSLVGERGPELIRMGAVGGMVSPSISGGSGGGSASLTINVSTPVLTPGGAQALANAIAPSVTRWQQDRRLIGAR